ncbi:hypothetical protein SAMN05421810_10194 [Amycolatopsis arida]|uniref:Uncharacterized protein n=1 Tax=Amycolatopsis arida TaxID=587909 RepID=A0A1I5KD08_9PSEU|nr:hypothetical protein CLV69_10292 [Amycolatopsis arida]SFO82858.1 hypothetical protein SAMN05421810_10194 [Amycolatopsis arida]
MSPHPQGPLPLGRGPCPFQAPGPCVPGVVWLRGCPVGPVGGWPCRTVPRHRAPCPGVGNHPAGVVAVPSMHRRQLPAVGSTQHSRHTGQPDTVPSVPLCSPVTRCAGARTPAVRPIPVDPVGKLPLWPITGRSLAGSWLDRDSTRTDPSMAEGCASGATTGTPLGTQPPEVVAGEPDTAAPAEPEPDRPAGRRSVTEPRPVPAAGHVSRHLQGVTPPPAGQSWSSARPGGVPTHFHTDPGTLVGGDGRW